MITKKEDEFSTPFDFTRKVHIDKDMNWIFDPSIDPLSVFQIQNTVGRGAFAVVCHIKNQINGQDMAGKIIDLKLLDENQIKAIQHEVDILKLLKSPNIIHYYGCVTMATSRMLLFEYCDKGSFREILDQRKKPLTENQISIVIYDLLTALNTLHNKYKIIHRDIKAANLLLNSKCETKLCDFGVSWKLDENGGHGKMEVIGTPYWIAPEVINGEVYSYPADIWSVGITAIELAEGAPPLVELSPIQAMMEISRNGFSGLRQPEIHTQQFTSFLNWCLKHSPTNRATISQLLQHPFIKNATQLDRKVVMGDLLNTPLPDYSQMITSSDQNSDLIPSTNILSATDINPALLQYQKSQAQKEASNQNHSQKHPQHSNIEKEQQSLANSHSSLPSSLMQSESSIEEVEINHETETNKEDQKATKTRHWLLSKTTKYNSQTLSLILSPLPLPKPFKLVRQYSQSSKQKIQKKFMDGTRDKSAEKLSSRVPSFQE